MDAYLRGLRADAVDLFAATHRARVLDRHTLDGSSSVVLDVWKKNSVRSASGRGCRDKMGEAEEGEKSFFSKTKMCVVSRGRCLPLSHVTSREWRKCEEGVIDVEAIFRMGLFFRRLLWSPELSPIPRDTPEM